MLLILLIGSIFTACKKDDNMEASSNPQANPLEVVEGPPGTVVTVTGSGLAGMRSIIFDNNQVPAPFNPVFNNANAVLFRVPDTAYGGLQNIILTNNLGREISLPFTVIALPSVASIFPAEFTAGSEVTITGNNLETAERVVLVGGAEATIISNSRREMVVQMPGSDADRVRLNITNESGDYTYGADLINLDNTLQVFTENFGDGFDNWSWGGSYTPSTEEFVLGSYGLQANMVGNSWGALSLHHGSGMSLADYQEVSFWIKGGAVETTYQFSINWNQQQNIAVPANDWTHFRFPLSIWKNEGINQVDDMVWQVEGDGALIYFDNIIFIK